MTRSVGLFYGSTTGTTDAVARLISEKFQSQFDVFVELLNIADYYLEDMLDFEFIILGIPTWNVGQLQIDWEEIYTEFDDLDLSGRKIAIFGLGDQVGYPDTFADAVFFLASKVEERGAVLVGKWPTTGYTYQNSWAVRDDRFLGLVLDQHSQSHLTHARLNSWIEQLAKEFGFNS